MPQFPHLLPLARHTEPGGSVPPTTVGEERPDLCSHCARTAEPNAAMLRSAPPRPAPIVTFRPTPAVAPPSSHRYRPLPPHPPSADSDAAGETPNTRPIAIPAPRPGTHTASRYPDRIPKPTPPFRSPYPIPTPTVHPDTDIPIPAPHPGTQTPIPIPTPQPGTHPLTPYPHPILIPVPHPDNHTPSQYPPPSCYPHTTPIPVPHPSTPSQYPHPIPIPPPHPGTPTPSQHPQPYTTRVLGRPLGMVGSRCQLCPQPPCFPKGCGGI